VIREAVRANQEQLLNTALLVRIWPDLILPVRCRKLWEDRFPQLAGQ
jgi:hypothetical protein